MTEGSSLSPVEAIELALQGSIFVVTVTSTASPADRLS